MLVICVLLLNIHFKNPWVCTKNNSERKLLYYRIRPTSLEIVIFEKSYISGDLAFSQPEYSKAPFIDMSKYELWLAKGGKNKGGDLKK